MATKNVGGHLMYLITGDSKMLDTSLKGTQRAVAKFNKFVLSALGIGGAMMAFRTFIRIGKDLVAAYSEEEQATAKLAAAIRATGGDVEDLMSQYKAFASEIQAVTTMGDEQVLGLLQQARSFGIARDKMKEATQGAIGLSKAFGIDMNTALRGIALAYEGNYTQLSRYIPELRNAGTEAEKQAILQKAMAAGFEIARAEAQTGTGALLQLQNAIGDLKEQGGKMLLDFLAPSIRGLTEFVAKTTAAIAESRRLREVAKELSEGKQVAAVDEIALLQAQIKTLEAQRQMVKGYEESVRGIDEQIAAARRQIAVLTEVARWEAIGREAKRKGDAEAAAQAEAEMRRQQELAEWIKAVNAEYARTEQGQREILEAQIRKWEYELSRASVYKPQIQAILEMLYKQRDANVEITDTWKDRLDAMAAETDTAMAAYQLRLDAEAAYNEEMRRINEERRAAELLAEEVAAAKRDALRQASFDFAQSLLQSLADFARAQYQAELDVLDRKLARDLELTGENEEEKKKLREEYEAERAQLEYKAALAGWKQQMMGALASSARAIIEAAKNTWPIPAIPMMAMAAVLSATQLAVIRKQKPVPSFAGGADFVVPPGYPNDSYPMMVESGERVRVDPAGGAAAGGGEMLQATIVLDWRQIAQFVTRAVRNRQILVAQRGIVE